MHVDEARRQDAARPVRDGHAGMSRGDRGQGAGVLHPLPAGGVGADDQQAVFVEDRLAGVVESQKGGTVGLHGLGG